MWGSIQIYVYLLHRNAVQILQSARICCYLLHTVTLSDEMFEFLGSERLTLICLCCSIDRGFPAYQERNGVQRRV